ncbi:MAG TPA: acetyl-CoA carboxylase biotin carboxyl carrier protein subunit [Chryseolinea sp.]|nr:acetyl-CoA carboxylase biotin carboxyl carrier protein subunit [Chryseolinea sp.]
MYKATVNQTSFQITLDNVGLIINDTRFDWNLLKISDQRFHILIDHKSYNVEIVSADVQTKSFCFKINGRKYVVDLKDKFDLLLEKMGMNNTSANKINSIKAPMPGLIIDLRVKEGDQVKVGDPLLILEAMKMENIIKASGESIVKSVKVKKGESVEKNQVLIEF